MFNLMVVVSLECGEESGNETSIGRGFAVDPSSGLADVVASGGQLAFHGRGTSLVECGGRPVGGS